MVSAVARKSPLVQESPLTQDDTLFLVFSSLPSSNLKNAALVSKQWCNVANAPNFWRNHLEQKSQKHRLVEYFEQYVEKNFMTWKEACHYSSLVSFCARIEESVFLSSRWSEIQDENPILEDNFRSVMPQPRVRYGDLIFSISNSWNIKVQKKGKKQVEILQGERGQQLSHLAVERNFLFALRQDGSIVRYDLTTSQKITIPTSWALGNVNLHNPNGIIFSKFLVEQGFILIRYGTALDHIFEIIPYENIEGRTVVSDEDVPPPEHMVVNESKLYLFGNGRLFIWDLFAKEKIGHTRINRDLTGVITDIAVDKNLFCAVGDGKGFHMVDLQTKKHLRGTSSLLLQIGKVENLLFGATESLKDGVLVQGIEVIDLNSGRAIKQIPDVFARGEINPSAFILLVKICRVFSKDLTLSYVQPSPELIEPSPEPPVKKYFFWAVAALIGVVVSVFAIIIFRQFKKHHHISDN